MLIERLKFYADGKYCRNKLFCFKINSIFEAEESLKRFMKSMHIKAAWYECIIDGQRVQNRRIDLIQYIDYNILRFSDCDPAAVLQAQRGIHNNHTPAHDDIHRKLHEAMFNTPYEKPIA
jgi:hypothetical protein